MPLQWHHLRPWNGSQHAAFEALCCQLAEVERAPGGSRFTRKGTPDGGVEGFWQLPDGSEWAWQAKFFLSPPDDGQWGQLDDSVRTALTRHPLLRRYFICLPMDRPDARLPGRRSMLDRWNERVERWRGWAAEQGRSVEFEYWGDHELLSRLSREEHRGRQKFWFQEELLSERWLQQKWQEAHRSAGERYTPEVHVPLPIADPLDALGRTAAFSSWLSETYSRYGRRGSASDAISKLQYPMEQVAARKSLTAAEETWKEIEVRPDEPIPWDTVKGALEQATAAMDSVTASLRKAARDWQEQNPKAGRHSNPWAEAQDNASSSAYGLRHLAELADSPRAQASNAVAICIVGEAGTGKTHLLCDVAEARLQSGAPTVLLMGEQFAAPDPLQEIPHLLGLDITFEEFLGALSAAAQARDRRALLMIDALNESADRMRWQRRFMTLLTRVEQYPWVRLVVSVRTTYEELVIPPEARQHGLVRVKHEGFGDATYEATKRYFNAYGVQQPTVPMLNPEFRNPLFLKLFCKGLKAKGLHTIPPGLEGITAIFRFLIDAINERLAQTDRLDYDPRDQPVWQAVQRIAQALALGHGRFLPLKEVKALLTDLLPSSGYELSLFRQLLAEGLLVENCYQDWENGTQVEGIRFAYERLTEHLIVQHLLDTHLKVERPKETFRRNGPFQQYLHDERCCYRYRGVIEALSIQVPERIGRELIELAPHLAQYRVLCEAFVASLALRRPDAIKRKKFAHIANRYVLQWRDLDGDLLDALLTVAVHPRHALNADFLHRLLMRRSMPDRDAWWSVFLFGRYGNEDAVDRLIDWAWHPADKAHIEDEAIRLAGTALTWFLTCSHRFLRDRTTKALVNLLGARLHIVAQLLQQFHGADDLYVTERLYAVAYGCAMRSRDQRGLQALAQQVYDLVFREGEPPVHVLLRDHARGVIEVALAQSLPLDVNPVQFRPPYQSTWIQNIPTDEDIKGWEQEAEDNRWGAKSAIIHSVAFEMWDFSNYVIGKASGFEWTSRPLYGPYLPTQEEVRQAFEASLTGRQRAALTRLINVRTNIKDIKFRRGLPGYVDGNPVAHLTDEQLDEILSYVEERFFSILGKRKSAVFQLQIAPYLDSRRQRGDREMAFDLAAGKRWMVKRVFDLGWTVERFGEFDRMAVYRDAGRATKKAERMGKKYQWLAYHEFLARVADNFEYRADAVTRWNTEAHQHYNGPWQMWLRDIDPSWVIPTAQTEALRPTDSWWNPVRIRSWGEEMSHLEWLQSEESVPDLTPLFEVTDAQGKRWISLHGSFHYEPEDGKGRGLNRQLWVLVNAYLLRKEDLEVLYPWATQQRYMNRWMPEPYESHHTFIGEYPWSPAAWEQFFFPESEWRTIREEKNPPPVEVLVPAADYNKASNDFDCSVEEGASATLPTAWLFERLGLVWHGREGEYHDAWDRVVAQDPSVWTPGPATLLIERDSLLKLLEREGMALIWTVLGEKQLTGGNAPGWMELNGAYKLTPNGLEGIVRSEFRDRA